jgi:molybdopterin synthase sulfur carrier subunit
MTIRVQFFAQLRDVVGTSEIQVDVSEGSTVQTLLSRLYKEKPPLQNHDATILVSVDVEFVGRDYLLKPLDEIAIMPPVQGG